MAPERTLTEIKFVDGNGKVVAVVDSEGIKTENFKILREVKGMKLTREEAVKLHRELWGWLAENPMRQKTDYPGFRDERIMKYCYLCEYTSFTCEKCPVEWDKTHEPPAISSDIPCMASYFDDFLRATTPEERSRLAALIRDLPEKTEKVEEPKPAPKFSVGDRVRIKTDLIKGNHYDGGCFVDPEMSKYFGMTGNITEEPYKDRFHLDIGHIWYWSPSMFEPADPPKPTPKFSIGDKVVPVSKSASCTSFADVKLSMQRASLEYLTIRKIDCHWDGRRDVVEAGSTSLTHWYFLSSDLTPYIEPPKCKFKVGDKVRIVAQTAGWAGVKPGDVGTIKHIPASPDGDYGVDVPTFECNSLWEGAEECFELYTEPPKNKFKVGDIIKGNDPDRYTYTNSDMTKGEVVELVDNDKIRIKILEHKKDLCIGDSFPVEEQYFDLVVDEPKAEPKPGPKQNKFSVGDKVKCIRVYDNKEEALGKIGKIIDTSKAGNYYTVQFDEAIDGHSGMYKGVEGKNGYCWCFKPDYLELVKPDPEPAFKVGDRVRVIGGTHKGMIGIIKEIPSDATIAVQYTEKLTGSSNRWNEKYPCKKGYGWYEEKSWLEPFPINHAPENKTITEDNKTYIFKDNKTTCILDIDGRKFKGVAKCAPDDKWNELTGMSWSQIRAKRKALDYAEALLRRDF